MPTLLGRAVRALAQDLHYPLPELEPVRSDLLVSSYYFPGPFSA